MSVTLYLPGLFAPFQEISSQDVDDLSCDSLRLILSRSSRQTTPYQNEHWLYHQFNSAHQPGDSIPVAALTALADGLDGKEGFWMRADPVYLYPDTHSLILQDPNQLDISKDEASAIKQLIDPLLEDYSTQLLIPHPNRWYLSFIDKDNDEAPAISTTSLAQALSKPVNKYLPEGEDRRRWHTLFNEIQMVLNQSAVNQQREENRKQPINTLWFWGEGAFPQSLSPPYQQCLGNSGLVSGLCKATGVTVSDCSKNNIQDIEQDQDVLLVDERLLHAVCLNDPQYRLDAIQQIDHEILQPLMNTVKGKKIPRIELAGNRDTLHATQKQLKSFWRPVKKLSALLNIQ